MVRWLAVAGLVAAFCHLTQVGPPMHAATALGAAAVAAREQRTPGGSQEDPADLHVRAIGLLRASQCVKALELYDQILAVHPKDSEAHYRRALALSCVDRKTEAVGSLRRALDVGFTDVWRFTRDPALAGLRGVDSFDALLADWDAVLAEEAEPSRETIRRLLAEPRFHRFLPRLLPRHRSPELTSDTLRLLEEPDPSLVRAAVVSLLHQNADDASTRATITMLLDSPAVGVREAAAEYFVWHATVQDRNRLLAAAATEQDPFIVAAERAALDLASLRASWVEPGSPPSRVPESTTVGRVLASLKTRPTREVFRQAAAVYRSAWTIDPRLLFQGMDRLDTKELARQHEQFSLTVTLFGFSRPLGGEAGERQGSMPTATSFVAPVRDYFDPRRRSFGGRTGSNGPFANTVHCGDDVAPADDQTVVSVADGIVRRVHHTYSWGFIIVIEHKLPGRAGSCCSLYGHLAPSISVAPGQVVRKGQRIGAVGRTCTWENGGYGAHLHFGIHRGPYLQLDVEGTQEVVGADEFRLTQRPRPGPSWITGYLRPDRWDEGRHGWVDPQAFIRARLEQSRSPRVVR